jgi:DNA-binding CsgD family transcriptional regulator
MRSKVAADLQERLAVLRDTADGLGRDRLALLHKIRRSLAELRAGRVRLIQARRPAHSTSARAPTDDLAERFGLTPREAEVALLLADGHSNAAVARALSISVHTARHHTQHILVKVGVGSRSKAGAVIRRHLDVTPATRTADVGSSA